MLIESSGARSTSHQKLASVSSFYGLDLNVVSVKQHPDNAELLRAIRSPETVAVVTTAEALSKLDPRVVSLALHGRDKAVPWLIDSIDETTKNEKLERWSGGSIQSSGSIHDGHTASYAVLHSATVTGPLGGTTFPLNTDGASYLVIREKGSAEQLLTVHEGDQAYPVLARVLVDGQEVFFATNVPTDSPSLTADPYRQIQVFADLIVPMVFLHYAAGERAWHAPAAFANLTIDDVWLRQPYGHVDYEGLLKEAIRKNFHVTMAFIPWNFDRSQSRVVSLFRDYPNRLSIAIHGNNHVHQEFGPLADHPLVEQSSNIRQALGRMERFHQLTSIPYDRVMVFPHSISPTATLGVLRRYNYLATANSLSVPSDAAAPAGLSFALRSGSLDFENFPSLRRYSAETSIPRTQLAIDDYLGNPMLFYVHQNFFSAEIAAFNETADWVNRVDPSTQWVSLGMIAKHLYLEKLRDDGGVDVEAVSPVIQLENHREYPVTYHMNRREDFTYPITVFVGTASVPFNRTSRNLSLDVIVPAKSQRTIAVIYGNELALSQVKIAKDSTYVYVIRMLSDFRDEVVSRSNLGRALSASYVTHSKMWADGILALGCLVILTFGYLWWRKKRVCREVHIDRVSA